MRCLSVMVLMTTLVLCHVVFGMLQAGNKFQQELVTALENKKLEKKKQSETGSSPVVGAVGGSSIDEAKDAAKSTKSEGSGKSNQVKRTKSAQLPGAQEVPMQMKKSATSPSLETATAQGNSRLPRPTAVPDGRRKKPVEEQKIKPLPPIPVEEQKPPPPPLSSIPTHQTSPGKPPPPPLSSIPTHQTSPGKSPSESESRRPEPPTLYTIPSINNKTVRRLKSPISSPDKRHGIVGGGMGVFAGIDNTKKSPSGKMELPEAENVYDSTIKDNKPKKDDQSIYDKFGSDQSSTDNDYGIASTAKSSTDNDYGIASTAKSSTDNDYGFASTAKSSTDNDYGFA